MAADPDRRRLARSSSVRAPGAAFVCGHCGATVSPEGAVSQQRNHCPRCLHSLHVDLAVGDRRSLCRGLMAPIAAWVRANGEVALLHRCTRCGTVRSNRVAGDDDLDLLRGLVRRLAQALEGEPGGVA